MDKIKTKKYEIVNEKTLIGAVDISKQASVGYCRCPDGSEVKPFEFSNHRRGFEIFWEVLCKVKKAHGLQEVVVGLESTGCYGEPLIHYLRSRGVRVVQVNPLHTKRVKDLQGNSPLKTDWKDPKVIADIMELGHFLKVVIPEGPAAELRRLTQARERAIQRRTAFYNQLQELVFLLFPEFLEVMNNIKTKSALHLLRHYSTPQEMLSCGVEELTLILRRVSRGKFGTTRAQALCVAASESVGIVEGQQGLRLEIQEILSGVEVSERLIERIEAEMVRFLKQIPYSRWILSLKGIKEVTAAGLIGEVGDFRQFSTISEMMKLAGMDLFEISSGIHRGRRRISKRGRPLLRKLLFFAALNTVRKGGVMHACYQRYLHRGMPKVKALVAIARKLLRIIFALVRDHRQYQIPLTLQEDLNLAA